MPTIASIGVGIPKYQIKQSDAREFIRTIFPRSSHQIERLLPVFEHALIEERQLAVPVEWLKEEHSFEDRNRCYIQAAIDYAKLAIEDCLHHRHFLKQPVHESDIDCMIFVSSTGIATPSIDAELINDMPFSRNITRIPIWGLGCAGGASGLARAADYLRAHPDANVLLINAEFCSLSFQKDDHRKSNFVGSALFGDGVSCVLMTGDESKLRENIKHVAPRIMHSSSKFKRDGLTIMGWNIQNSGFHVIFSKSIPKLVESFWSEHINEFLHKYNLEKDEFPFFVAHPGGQRVLEAMEHVLNVSWDFFKFSYQVLKSHGNMSSPTVIFVLKKAMESFPDAGTKSLLSALGPGFSSELTLLEWKDL
ncbi:type III polyketide synthase BpsA [Salinibacillus aidingensis]|uniref:Type III polyketide synthase BpsA n=1 Tax=Salinibacillus aidingensis TaxID=237684 RepID=A0ABN1ANR6_9BACI